MNRKYFRLTFIAVSFLSLFVVAPALAAPPAAQEGASNLTVVFDTSAFTPAEVTVTADIYLDGVLVGAQVGEFAAPVSPGSHQLEVKNITPVEISAPPYNLLWRFKDASMTVYLNAGKDKTITVRLQVEALMNLASLTCNVRNWVDEEALCVVEVINLTTGENLGSVAVGGNMAGFDFDPTVTPWQVMLWLPAGKYSATFSLQGAQANLWSPPSLTKTFTQTLSTYNLLNDRPAGKASVSFNKAGHLLASLDQSGFVGDWYIDGVMVGTQTATIDQWVTPAASHKIEVKNITDPARPAIHPWKDVSSAVSVSSGQVKTVVIKLQAIPTDTVLISKPGCRLPNLTSQKYVTLRMRWGTATKELAEQNADHMGFVILLDGVDLGDIRAYRKPVQAYNSQVKYGCSSDMFLYWATWDIPVGKLAAGTHTLLYNPIFDMSITDGFEVYPAGPLFDTMRENIFEVAP